MISYGNWGLGIGPNPQSPIPNPQSPIPINYSYYKFNLFHKSYIKLNNKLKKKN